MGKNEISILYVCYLAVTRDSQVVTPVIIN